MANYETWERTSYFKVRDREAFNEFARHIDAAIVEQEHPEHGTILALIPNGDGFSDMWEDDDGKMHDVEWFDELAKHIADGWYAIGVHVGHEKLRYCGFWMGAIGPSGHRVDMNQATAMKDIESKMSGLLHTEPEY